MTDAPPPTQPRAAGDLPAVLLLLLLPVLLLGDCFFGGRHYLPYDLAEFPPVATTLDAGQVTALREGSNYDATEPPIWFVPELTLARQALQRGQYPHWDPYVRLGAPLTAHGHLGLLNPLHWPALLFDDPGDGLLYLTWLMFALAGTLMYGLLRALGLERGPALFGGVAFALSGTLTANGHWYMRMEPLALLPGMLWACLSIARRNGRARARPTVALAVLMGLCWTAGFPPFQVPVSLLVGGFALLLVLRAWRQDGRAALGLCGWFALGLGLGLGLAMVQLVQQLEFFPVSNRPPAPSLPSQSRFAFDPMGLLGWLLPDAFSHPSDRAVPGASSPLAFLLFSRREWGTGAPLLPNYNFTEYALFAGTLPLLLALVGLLHRGPRWRFLCAGTLALLVALAMGVGPLSHFYGLPVVGGVPPYRYMGPVCVLVALLAALGAQQLARGASPVVLRALAVVALLGAGACFWQRASLGGPEAWLATITDHYRELAPQIDPNLRPEQVTPELVRQFQFTGSGGEDYLGPAQERLRQNLLRAGLALGAGGVVLVLLSLRRRRLGPVLGALGVLLTGAELGCHGHRLNRGKELPVPHDSAVHGFLRGERDRLAAEGGFLVARGDPRGRAMHLPPGSLAQDGIRDLHFYTFVDRWSSEPFRRLYGERFMVRDYMPGGLLDDERLRLPWFDVIGLRYVLAIEPMRHAGVQVGPELRGPGGAFYVYERPSALSRAWTVPTLRVVADEAAMLQAVIAPDLQPRAAAVVTAETARLVDAPGPALRDYTPGARLERDVRFVVDDGKNVVLEVAAGEAGFLVLADTWLPGWACRIGDAIVPILRGNLCQRVVPLPAGAVTVRFSYFTPGLGEGLVWSGLALLLCVVLVWLGRRGAPTQL